MKLGALAGGPRESDVAGAPSETFSRTSFTMSAGDLKTKGGSGDSDSFLEGRLLLGGV